MTKASDMARLFWENGFRVFGLYGVGPDGKCQCGQAECGPKALFKHPRIANWQHTPVWGEEQFENMMAAGHFDSGFGIVMKDTLGVDVDPRNGGLKSLMVLQEDIPAMAGAGMVVRSGSGPDSKHFYYRVPPGMSLARHVEKYPGIDFISGKGFLVGPGSMHASGREYEILIGAPDEIDDAPQELLDALAIKSHYRSELDGQAVDVSKGDLLGMLQHILNSDVDYDQWLKIGMSLHHASGGTAYDLWEDWSRTSRKHDDTQMMKKWNSFGVSANPVTLATLVYHAEKGGWVRPVTFQPSISFDIPEPPKDEIDTSAVDLTRPPGIVGQVAEWIESRSHRPREKLAAYAALQLVSNLIGLRYTDDITRVIANLFIFCVAGSATGKKNALDRMAEIMVECGFGSVVLGGIKSEQEIVRNMIEHQASCYQIDEVGFLLGKIKSAQTRGGASYLEGVIGILMAAYSSGDSYLPVSGDLRRFMRDELIKKIGLFEKKNDEDPKDYLQVEIESLRGQLEDITSGGIRSPFLSMIGFTTSNNFDANVDHDAVANGFIGRCLICREQNDYPRLKENWTPGRPIPEGLKMALQQLADGGSFQTGPRPNRIEYRGKRVVIPTTDEARRMLKLINTKMDDLAEELNSRNGLQPLALRGAEVVSKISLILGAPGGIRTEEHVRWAYALVVDDINKKSMMVISNDTTRTVFDRVMSHIMLQVDEDNGQTIGAIVNNSRKFKREEIDAGLKKLVEAGYLREEDTESAYNKRKTKRYYLIKKR